MEEGEDEETAAKSASNVPLLTASWQMLSVAGRKRASTDSPANMNSFMHHARLAATAPNQTAKHNFWKVRADDGDIHHEFRTLPAAQNTVVLR